MDLWEKKLNGDIVYKGSFLTLERDTVLCPNGNTSYREVLRHPGASAMLARVGDKYIIERQFRYALNEVIYEIPAGKKDAGESFLECAVRELEEECGYKASSVKYLGEIYTTVGFTDEKIAIFLCDGLVKTNQKLDEDEMVELELYTLDELKDMVRNGIIKDAKTIAAISYVML